MDPCLVTTVTYIFFNLINKMPLGTSFGANIPKHKDNKHKQHYIAEPAKCTIKLFQHFKLQFSQLSKDYMYTFTPVAVLIAIQNGLKHRKIFRM